jgi:hypothetical protein
VIDFAFTGVSSENWWHRLRADRAGVAHPPHGAFLSEVPAGQTLNLGDPGYNRYRKAGERHALTTEVIKNFHTS